MDSVTEAEELGLDWLAENGAHGMVAGPNSALYLQSAHATAKALDKEGIAAADLDLVQFNEAFAAVGIESMRALGLSEEKVNVNGAVALCGGGGPGDALILRVPRRPGAE